MAFEDGVLVYKGEESGEKSSAFKRIRGSSRPLQFVSMSLLLVKAPVGRRDCSSFLLHDLLLPSGTLINQVWPSFFLSRTTFSHRGLRGRLAAAWHLLGRCFTRMLPDLSTAGLEVICCA